MVDGTSLEPGTDVIERRRLIPSPRELDLGVGVADYHFVSTKVDRPRFSVKQAFVDWARTADPRGLEGPKSALVILGLASFSFWFNLSAVLNLLPNIQGSLGIDLSFLAAFGLISQLMLQLFAPPFGHLSDHVKRVWLVRVGSMVNSLGVMLQGIAPGVGPLVGARFLGGIGASAQEAASGPLFADYFKSTSRARAFAVGGLLGVGGRTFGPSVSGMLADSIGWRQTLVVLGIGSLAVSALTFFLKEPKRGYLDRLEMGATEEQAQQEQEAVSFAEAYRTAGSIVTVRRLWYVAPFVVLVTGAEAVYLPVYYASVFQLDASSRGFLVTAAAVFGLFGLVFAGPVGDRILTLKPARAMTVFAIPQLFGAVAFAVVALSPWLWLAFAVTLPFQFFGNLLLPMQLTLMSLIIPPRVRGLGIQTQAPFLALGTILLIFVLPSLIGGNIRHVFLFLIPASVAIAVIYGSMASGVDRDIRAARAASIADQEAERARKAGRSKMLVCRDVDVTYDGVQVLFNVDFDVEQGDIIALLGTNGAGKSTLLRAIAGTQQASNGAIFFDGRDITHAPPYENAQRGIVIMPGGNAVFPTLTVEENLRAAAWMYRDDEAYVADGIERVLGYFPSLRERLEQPAGNLSGGEQQMVGVGQALLMKPRLLMIDELSLGLAPRVVELLLDTLRVIHAEGTTVIIVEQSLNVALTIAERAVFMEKGEIRFSGPTAELMQRPDLIRAVFMGGVGGAGRVSTSRARANVDEPGRALLSIRDVSVGFGGVQALRAVDLEVKDNEIVGVIGPNGAGKTTLFDVISGFVKPDTGTVALVDDDVSTLSPDARARLGLARSFQNARLFPSLTVRENIAVALEQRAVKSAVHAMLWTPKKRRNEQLLAARVDDLIDLLRLEAYAGKFVGELSTGTRRAVDIACIMAAAPKLLLLDEPSSGLAQVETEELGPVLKRVARDAGCGLLVIEHDLPLIGSISDRLYALELGAVVTSGTPVEVLNDERVLASYLSATEEVLARSDSTMVTIASAVRGSGKQLSETTRKRG